MVTKRAKAKPKRKTPVKKRRVVSRSRSISRSPRTRIVYIERPSRTVRYTPLTSNRLAYAHANLRHISPIAKKYSDGRRFLAPKPPGYKSVQQMFWNDSKKEWRKTRYVPSKVPKVKWVLQPDNTYKRHASAFGTPFHRVQGLPRSRNSPLRIQTASPTIKY